MADLRDGFLRALLAQFESGHGLALVLSVKWGPGAISGGPATCTCWVPIFDLEQKIPDPATHAALVLGETQPETRRLMCGDCAYRPNSPEKEGSEDAQCDATELERIARESRFWCHDGIKRPRAWWHPRGVQIPAHDADTGMDYQPLILDGIPYRANGQPGALCAGWAARRRALVAGDAR